jgi:hypothetical protein
MITGSRLVRRSGESAVDGPPRTNVLSRGLLPVSEVRCEPGAVPQLWSSFSGGQPGRLMDGLDQPASRNGRRLAAAPVAER